MIFHYLFKVWEINTDVKRSLKVIEAKISQYQDLYQVYQVFLPFP